MESIYNNNKIRAILVLFMSKLRKQKIFLDLGLVFLNHWSPSLPHLNACNVRKKTRNRNMNRWMECVLTCWFEQGSPKFSFPPNQNFMYLFYKTIFIKSPSTYLFFNWIHCCFIFFFFNTLLYWQTFHANFDLCLIFPECCFKLHQRVGWSKLFLMKFPPLVKKIPTSRIFSPSHWGRIPLINAIGKTLQGG